MLAHLWYTHGLSVGLLSGTAGIEGMWRFGVLIHVISFLRLYAGRMLPLPCRHECSDHLIYETGGVIIIAYDKYSAELLSNGMVS